LESSVITEGKEIMLFKKFGNKYFLSIDRGEEIVDTMSVA